jgi:C1A family cysteine protease
MSDADLRDRLPPVRSQRGLESCTAIAISDAVGWEFRRREPHGARELFEPSPLFVYYNARKRAGEEMLNTPVRPSDAMAAVQEYGICPESAWPYSPMRYRNRPPVHAYKAARAHAGLTFEQLEQDERALKDSLSEGAPFFLCLRLFPSNCEDFDRGETALTGRLALPRPDEAPIRNHAMLAVGYDDASSVFVLRNSFGRGWGREGHLFLPYEYVLDPERAYAFWRVDRGAYGVVKEMSLKRAR